MKRSEKLNIFNQYLRIPGHIMSNPFKVHVNGKTYLACFYFYVDGKFWTIDRVVILEHNSITVKKDLKYKIIVEQGIFTELKARHCVKYYIKKELTNDAGKT